MGTIYYSNAYEVGMYGLSGRYNLKQDRSERLFNEQMLKLNYAKLVSNMISLKAPCNVKANTVLFESLSCVWRPHNRRAHCSPHVLGFLTLSRGKLSESI
jgi:hypothetical protein